MFGKHMDKMLQHHRQINLCFAKSISVEDILHKNADACRLPPAEAEIFANSAMAFGALSSALRAGEGMQDSGSAGREACA
jgi:hypothetical protein